METGKEIYKEYFDKLISAIDDNERTQINKDYTCQCFSVYEQNKHIIYDTAVIVSYLFEEFENVKRAPKTQMINGHEVIAPMHDMPKSEDYCYWLDFSADSGVCSYDAESLSESEKQSLSINGWFDNKENAIAYAKAHRDSK